MTKTDSAILAMTERDVERFLSKVNKSPGQGPGGECHLWTAALDAWGYGNIGMGTGEKKAIVKAHRVAYFLANGELPPPEKPHALHSCDEPSCCNDEHLWAGTNADNVADKTAKGRGNQPRGDRNGSRTRPGSRPRGEGHYNSSLTNGQRAEVRRLYAAGNVLQRELGEMFGVCQTTISRAVHERDISFFA